MTNILGPNFTLWWPGGGWGRGGSLFLRTLHCVAVRPGAFAAIWAAKLRTNLLRKTGRTKVAAESSNKTIQKPARSVL